MQLEWRNFGIADESRANWKLTVVNRPFHFRSRKQPPTPDYKRNGDSCMTFGTSNFQETCCSGSATEVDGVELGCGGAGGDAVCASGCSAPPKTTISNTICSNFFRHPFQHLSHRIAPKHCCRAARQCSFPNTATPACVPTNTFPFVIMGVMNLFPGPNWSREPC